MAFSGKLEEQNEDTEESVIVYGGKTQSTLALNDCYMYTPATTTWRNRYSHTAHVLGDFLVLFGGVNFSHSPPGVAVIHLPSGNSAEFSLPAADKNKLIMLHGHTSVSMDNNRILLLGGGGNCFSFETHLNSSPIIMDITKTIQMMEQV